MAKTVERRLTIGMAAHQDLKGPWHTVQSIIEANWELREHFEFVILDNSPPGSYSDCLRDWAHKTHNTACPINYSSIFPRQSTSLRNLVFDASNTEYVMCIDSHVILGKYAIPKLLKFLASGEARDDLFQGPLFTESGGIMGTHMNPAFRGGNFGTWGVMKHEDGTNFDPAVDKLPFEIPSHGMGLWVTRRDSWLRYPQTYNHFSGEEGYIQEKYRLHGRKAWCLPFLKWVHCFGHVGGASYKNTNYDKCRNHLIAFKELGLSIEYPFEYYANICGQPEAKRALESVEKLDIQPIPRPPGLEPFLGFPMRINDRSRNEPQDYQVVERRLAPRPTPPAGNHMHNADVQPVPGA